MKKCINIAIWLQLVIISYVNAQKYDANWVFGRNAGIYFDSLNNPLIFKSKILSLENPACISSLDGKLNFFITNLVDSFGQQLPFYCNILDTNGLLIENGDSILAWISSTSGPVILPVDKNDSFYYIFHVGWNKNFFNTTCATTSNCLVLYYSTIRKINNKFIIENKNIPLLHSVTVSEKISLNKHANGNDSWLVAHTHYTDSVGIRKNRFYKWFIKDTFISTPFFQEINTKANHIYDLSGQMQFSNTGNLLGVVSHSSNLFEIYDFNRCSGEIIFKLDKIITGVDGLYGLEFSPNEKLLYLTSIDSTKVLQVDITDTQLHVKNVYLTNRLFGQLQLAWDGKIYIANQNTNSSSEYINNTFNQYNQNLSVIHQPDSAGLACDFQPFSFYLGDSSKSSLGLPNFPNYRLGALSIYEAHAGNDTVLCIDSTVNQKVVVLGSPPISGVQYQWYPNYNLSSDTVAQPLAYPDTSTMYYLMLSDTTITNACKTRLDSVYVEVKICITSAHGQLSTVHSVKVFPNPASSEIKIESEKHKIAHVTIYDVAGKALLSPFEGGVCSHCAQAGDEIIINIKELSQGIYFIHTQLSNGQITINKLVKQ